MELTTVWFCLIAVLWVGYFALEGFDFGVGMLLPVLGREERERRVLINTIGPVWDGNEVWVLVAGGATFFAVAFLVGALDKDLVAMLTRRRGKPAPTQE
jgi:cytochrome d ubiquinol oxidase subunit II